MDNEFSQIEQRLQANGWERMNETSLVLGANLLPCMPVKGGPGRNGGTVCLKDVWIGRSKTGWYVLGWNASFQNSGPGGSGPSEDIGGKSRFEPRQDAVSLGGLAITVNTDLSLVRFWKKKSAEAPSEGQPPAQSPPAEAQPTE